MLTIVTGNTKKYTQISSVIGESIATRQEKIDLEEIQTADLRLISADKCRKAYQIVQGPVLVDDSGIVFDAYPGFPGALTKFVYEGLGFDGLRRLMKGAESDRAEFRCVLSYMDETLDAPMQFVGVCPGRISFDRLERGDADPKIPYDLIFVPDGMQTPAYFDMTTWTGEISHRYQASMMCREWLER